jgi:galactokinase
VATGSPVRQATSLFQERFGSAPLVVASAPGRINLIGEHTDYNGGPVLPFAIERRTAAAAGHADRWEVISAVDGWVHRLDVEDTGAEAAGWTAYARAVIRTLARSGPLPRGGRIAVASAVPVGAGLSSSAALTVSLTRALLALAGRREPTYAFTAEHDEVGVHCGRMDQTVAVLAEPGKALYFETGSGLLRLVPLESRVLVFETGVSHLLTGGELNQRRRECEVALDLLREAGRPLADLASLPLQELPWAVRRTSVAPHRLRLELCRGRSAGGIERSAWRVGGTAYRRRMGRGGHCARCSRTRIPPDRRGAGRFSPDLRPVACGVDDLRCRRGAARAPHLSGPRATIMAGGCHGGVELT